MAKTKIITAIALLPPSQNIDFAKEKWNFQIVIDFESLASYSEKAREGWYVFWVRKDGSEDEQRIVSGAFFLKIDIEDMLFDNKGRLMMPLKIKNIHLEKAHSFYYSLFTKYDIKHYAEHRNNSSGGDRIPVEFRSENEEYYENLRLQKKKNMNSGRLFHYLYNHSNDIGPSDLAAIELFHDPLDISLSSFDLGRQSGANSSQEKQDGGSETEKLRQKIMRLELANHELRNQLNTYKSKQDSDNRMRNAVVSADVSKLKKEHIKVQIELVAANRDKDNLIKENERLKKNTWGAGSNIGEEINRLRNNYKLILQENAKLESKVAEKEDIIKSLKKIVKETTDFENEYRKKLADELQKREAELMHSSREKEKLKNQINKTESEHSAEIAHLETEIQELKSQISKYKRLEEQIDLLLQKS